MIRFDFSEIERWSGLLDAEVGQIEARVSVAVGAQTTVVASRASADVPVLTGRLRGSIRRSGRGLRQRVRAGGGKAYYGHFQEFGTRKMTANPFLLKQANDQAQSEFEDRVDRALAAGTIYR